MQLQRVGRGAQVGSGRTVPRPPSIPGVALCRALHADGVGPPWRGRDTMTGQDVALRPLPAAMDATELTSLPDHAHLSVVSVWRDADGHTYTGTELAVHGCLDSLVAKRGPLTPGETAMVVMTVGRALATLHASGRVHGSLTMRAVLVDATMRPRLDASLCRPTPLSSQECERLATEDVRALGAVAAECLGGDLPPALRVVLSAATDPMASLRPTAVELVRSTIAAVPPEGLRLTGHQHSTAALVEAPPTFTGRLRARARRRPPAGSAAVEPRARRRHAGPRRAAGRSAAQLRPAPLLVAIGLLAAAVGAGTVWARASQGDVGVPVPHAGSGAANVATDPSRAADPMPSLMTSATRPDWTRVLRGLDVARSAAFANADSTVLSSVDAPGSPALASDMAAVRSLGAANVQARGYRVTTSAVRIVSQSPSDAVLDVTDARSAYQLVDAMGDVVQSQPARAVQTWHVHLALVAGTWLVHDVQLAG